MILFSDKNIGLFASEKANSIGLLKRLLLNTQSLLIMPFYSGEE